MNRKDFLKHLVAGGTGLSFLGFLQGCETSEIASEGFLPSSPLGASWPAVRAAFPIEDGLLYMNTGGLGPPSQPVLDAMMAQNLKQAQEGETYHSLLEELRVTAARFNGAEPKEMAFTRNATESTSIIAAGLELGPGDEVIFENEVHPGGSFPWMNQQKLNGVKVRVFEPDRTSPEGNLERIAALTNERTRVIQVSHVTAPTGLLFDAPAIAEFARERGIWFHLDGAQTSGMFPLNIHALECDSYATSGHKWLNGPQGTGFLFIKRDRVDDIVCSHLGAYSNSAYELPDTFAYRDAVARHEYGTRNAADILGLTVAMEFQEAIGRERIAEHGKYLVGKTREAIQDLPNLEILTPERDDMHASIITFRIPGREAHEMAGIFKKEHQIRVRPVTELGLEAVRLSWHVYHQESDIERVVDVIRTLV